MQTTLKKEIPSLPVDFRRLFESAPGLFLVLDSALIILAVSDAYLNATMTKREEIIGRWIFEVFPDNPKNTAADGTRKLRGSLDRVLEKRVADTMAIQRYDVRRPDSGEFEARYWSPVNTPVLSARGDVDYIIHRVEDVTEFVRLKEQDEEQSRLAEELKTRAGRIEAEVYRSAQKLQDANLQLRTINEELVKQDRARLLAEEERDRFFQCSHEFLCVAGYEGHFKQVNPAFAAALGYTPDELCALRYLDIIHPDDIEKTKQEVESQLSRGALVVAFENRYRARDGSYKLLSWNSTPTPECMYGSARDITALRESEEMVRRAKESAEAANRELEAFCYSVAHDLRAPLRSLDGFSQVLLEDYGEKFEGDASDYLQRIRKGTQRMGQLIDDLLRLSRVSRAELRRERVDLSGLVRSVATRLLEEQPNRQVQLVVQDGLALKGDVKLLEAALENLLGNALKYTSKHPHARIEVGQERDASGEQVFFVRDDGAGFDMTYVDKLFGTFQRLHGSNEFPGTGVGLATVQRIVHRHGGRIWATAAVEEGATFYFTVS